LSIAQKHCYKIYARNGAGLCRRRHCHFYEQLEQPPVAFDNHAGQESRTMPLYPEKRFVAGILGSVK
jgi:hypothetical protein